MGNQEPGDFVLPGDVLGNDPPSTDTPGGGGGSTADPFFSDKTKAQKYSLLQSVYTSLWGEPATEEYLKAAVNQGFNRWEFEERERNKPAFRKTETYRDDASNLADLLHSLGVV